MALKQPIKTTTNANTQSATAARPQLPAPHVFDILPALHELLARVDAYNTQSLPGHDTEDHTTLEDGTADIGSEYIDVQPLNPKELSLATLDIKARIRNALKELEKLPDMDRAVEEQREEMDDLEVRIKKQRDMLQELAGVADKMDDRLSALG